MGGLNAKVRQGRYQDIVGPFGLGTRNDRGDMWVEWCNQNDQIVVKTWFCQHPRRYGLGKIRMTIPEIK